MCAQRQSEILTSAAQMLAPGGRLVYSTCTFSPAENEGVISDFLKKHPDFSVVKTDSPYFSPGRPQWLRDPAPGIEYTHRLWPHLLRGEGHFAAVLQKDGDDDTTDLPTVKPAEAPPEFAALRQELEAAVPEGKLFRFGANLCCVPPETPELHGLKVLRTGLELGENLKNRFQPAHAWALWLKTAANRADFAERDPMVRRYLQGEAIAGTARGWTLVTVDGLSLGWAKGSDGVLKNHFPKGLRHLPEK